MSTMDELPTEGACDDSRHLIILVKGRERYFWLWDDDNFMVAVKSILRFVCSRELSLTLVDSSYLIRRMTEMQMESEDDKTPRQSP